MRTVYDVEKAVKKWGPPTYFFHHPQLNGWVIDTTVMMLMPVLSQLRRRLDVA